jgi:hypothetical protein
MLSHYFDLTNLIVAILGVIIGALAVWYGRRGVMPSNLVVAGDDEGKVRSGPIPFLTTITDGDKTETVDLRFYGLFTDLSPQWDDETKEALPLRLTFFVENKSWRTAKNAKIFVPPDGIGFRIELEGSSHSQAIPAKSFLRRQPERQQCRELGDIGPGMKVLVALIIHLGRRLDLEAIFRGGSERLVLSHDYYLSADDAKVSARGIWMNLDLPPRKKTVTDAEVQDHSEDVGFSK